MVPTTCPCCKRPMWVWESAATRACRQCAPLTTLWLSSAIYLAYCWYAEMSGHAPCTAQSHGFVCCRLQVHGRWNYRRVSLTILYSFYKNVVFVLTLFYFGFSNGSSGERVYL